MGSTFDPNIIKTIVAVVMILIDVLIVGIGIVYLLFGMLFGTRKSLRRLLSFVIPFGIFLLSINLLTNIILNATVTNWFSDGTVAEQSLLELGTQMLSELLGDNLYNGDYTAAAQSEIIGLAQVLAETILRLVIYLVGLFITAFIIAPFLRFISWLSYRIQIKGKPKQKMSWASRIGGMGIASISFVILIFVLILPISGAFSTVDMLLDDALLAIEVVEEQEVKVDSETDTVLQILANVDQGLDYSPSRKIIKLTRGKNDEASFDMSYLGMFLRVKTDDAKLNLLEEYGRIHTLIPTAVSVYNAVDSSYEVSYEDIIKAVSKEDVEKLAHVLKDSELVNLVLPVGYDYLGYYLESEGILEENNITKEMIDSININKDFDQIVDALQIVLEIVVTEDLNFESEAEIVEIIFTNDKISSNLQIFINNILTTSTVQNIGLPLASSFLVEFVESNENESFKELAPLLTVEKLNLYLENDISSVFGIAHDIYKTPLNEVINAAIAGKDPTSVYVDFSDPKITSVAESTIIKLMGLNIIHGNENTIVKLLMESLLDEYSVQEILFDEEGKPRIDWENETNIIASTVVMLLETFGENLMYNISDTSNLIICLLDSENAEQIVDKITDSDFAESLVVTFVYDFLQKNESIEQSLKDVLTKEAIKNCFEYDIVTLIHSVKSLYDTSAKEQIISLIKGEEEFDINAIDFSDVTLKENIKMAISDILTLKVISGNEEELLETVIALINESNENININALEILYDNGNKYINWEEETNNIASIVVEVLAMFSGNFTGELEPIDYLDIVIANKNTKDVLNDLVSSKLLEKVVSTVLGQLIASAEEMPEGLKEIFTEDALKVAFKEDIITLYDILVELYGTPLKDAILNTFLNNATFNPDLTTVETQNALKNTITKIMKLSIVEGNEETLIETLMSNIEGLEIDLASILYDENGNKYLNWDQEVTTLCDALIKVINVLGSDFSNFTFELLQEKLLSSKEETKDFVDTISESEIVRAIILDIIPDLIQEADMIPEEILAFFTTEKFEALKEKEAFKNEMNLLLDVIIDILDLGITDFESFEITIEKQPLLKDALTKLVQSSFIKGEEEELIKSLISNIDGFDINLDAILYDEDGNKYINWEHEIVVLCDALFEVLNVLGTDFSSFDLDLLQEKLLSDKQKTENFVYTISESQIIRAIILELIPDMIAESDLLPEDLAGFFSKEKFKALEEKETFQVEMNLLLDVVGDLLDLGITDFESFEITSENQALLKDALTKLIESSFIKGEEETLFKLFMDTTNFTGMLEENGITLDYSNVTNWHNELVISIDVALGFVDVATGEDFKLGDLFSGNMSEEEIKDVADLFDKIGESELFKPIVYQLIDNVGYDIEITEEDKVLIEANGFGNEITSLLEVIGGAQSLLEAEDLSTLKGSDVQQLMVDASNGIITSKVVGTLLETALGPSGLNINPTDEFGNPKYDFTDPATLKAQSSNIANLIDLANSMNSFDINNTTSVTDITEALKGLENNELAEDTLKEITGVEVNLEELDIEQETTLIEDVYLEYSNSADKENFVPSEEVIEKLEESNLAETILGILGIIK